MAAPEQVSVLVGLDVGKETHFADVLNNDGERLFSRPFIEPGELRRRVLLDVGQVRDKAVALCAGGALTLAAIPLHPAQKVWKTARDAVTVSRGH